MLQQHRHVQPAIPNANAPTIDGATTPAALQDIVMRHEVSYEVWPEWSGCGGRAKRVGYCVSICGVNEKAECVRGHHVPGCLHCGLTYDDMRKIAEWITLKEQPDCRFEIEHFDRAFHIAPRQRWSRTEILVTVKILHSHSVDLPVNDSLEHCLNQLRVELRKLGVREGVWQVPKIAAQ